MINEEVQSVTIAQIIVPSSDFLIPETKKPFIKEVEEDYLMENEDVDVPTLEII